MRTVERELVVDTCLFSPLQLQPRALFAHTFGGLAQWFKAHICSMPELLGEHRTGMVFLNLRLEYLEGLGFFDADTLKQVVSVRLLRDGSRIELISHFSGVGLSSGNGKAAAVVSALLCPVSIEEPTSMAARPAAFSSSLQEQFSEDERGQEVPGRIMPGLLAELEAGGERLGEGESEFVISRHMAEVADQWSFAEIPCIVESGRERLALGKGANREQLSQVLSRPLRRMDVELSRPYFTFDRGLLVTQALRQEERLVFVHKLGATLPGIPQHGVVVERF